MGEVEGFDSKAPPCLRRQPVVRPPFPAAPFEDAVDHPDDLVDRQFMAEALRLAARIPRRPWPNPPVGALVVREGRVVGRGAHHGAGTDHAETVAFREAGASTRGATLYCTLEPCNHQGRTPPCAPAVLAAGIARVVVSMRDPNPVSGGGLQRLREAGVETRLGVLAEGALDLVWPFVATEAFERPFVVLKTATSLDGFFARPPESHATAQPLYLTGPEARHDVHCLRRWCDVVLVGRQTMLVDAPQLDGRLVTQDDACPATEPIPAYVDTGLGLGAGWPRPHWVFAGVQAAAGPRRHLVEKNGGAVVPCDELDGHVDPRSLVARFRERGGHVLLVEGGPSLAASFLRQGLVDRWITYVAPLVLGDGVRWPTGSAQGTFHLTRAERIGPDAKAVFDRLSFDDTLAAVGGEEGAR
jgi:diaminohydroxyphosphoribosylaminopyrimidine deaminase / 5-amino-6-(5-phosphoribosylamino)uracil reductase